MRLLTLFVIVIIVDRREHPSAAAAAATTRGENGRRRRSGCRHESSVQGCASFPTLSARKTRSQQKQGVRGCCWGVSPRRMGDNQTASVCTLGQAHHTNKTPPEKTEKTERQTTQTYIHTYMQKDRHTQNTLCNAWGVVDDGLIAFFFSASFGWFMVHGVQEENGRGGGIALRSAGKDLSGLGSLLCGVERGVLLLLRWATLCSFR